MRIKEKNLNRFKQIHKGKYIYEDLELNKGYITVRCPKHGCFTVRVDAHLRGVGCPECRRLDRANLLLDKLHKKYKGKYTFDINQYTETNIELDIFCKRHQSYYHINGTRNLLRVTPCVHCQQERLKERTKSNEQYIIDAKKVHGDFYDYSNTQYKNARTDIDVICPIHGSFKINPHYHLQGSGCRLCGIEKSRLSKVNSKETNVAKAQEKHHDKYDYSLVKDNINNRTNVPIICPIHGVFYQTWDNHLKGCGCPSCKQTKLEETTQRIIRESNFELEVQKTFDWLIYDKKMRIDIYIPQYSIAIECQGEQHFYPIDFAHNDPTNENVKRQFQLNIGRDLKKIELCKEHGITLLHYATCKVPKDFTLYEVITSEEELINKIKEIVSKNNEK